MIIYYICRKQEYKRLLLLIEECIFENVILVVVKMNSDTINSGTMKVINVKFPQVLIYFFWLKYIISNSIKLRENC